MKKMRNKARYGVSFTSLREIRILKEYNHPNIIAMKDIFTAENALFLVMEYCCANLTEIIPELDETGI